MTIKQAENIINESPNAKEAINKLRNLPKRQQTPPPPEGGISLRAAERKYGIKNETLSKWTRQGYIPILLRTKNVVYIDEKVVSFIANRYNKNSGQGKWTIRKIMDELRSMND